MLHTNLNFSVTEGLVDLLERPVSAADRRRAALHLVDWLGTALIGRSHPTGQILATGVDLSAFPFGPDSEPEARAFALGGLGSLLEMDDLHRSALLHPGPVVVSAALAFGAVDTTGAAFLDAIIRGYEAMIRIGGAVGPSHYAFYHNTGTCGGFGAAVTAAAMLGLDRVQTVNALGLAGSIAGGLWQCRNEPVASKAFHVAEATRRGVASARLAARGLTAPRFILEGPQGFFAAQASAADPQDVLRNPDAPWKIWETSFKPWPACRHAHPTIDAALMLRDRIGSTDDVADILVESYRDALVFCDRAEPATELQAKFSLQHAAAVALLHGKPQLEHFDVDRLGDSDVASLRARVRVATDDALTAAYPSHFGSRVTVTLKDGSTQSQDVPDALGDGENPMSETAIFDKARMLMRAEKLSDAPIEALLAAGLALADGAPLSRLRDAARSSQ